MAVNRPKSINNDDNDNDDDDDDDGDSVQPTPPTPTPTPLSYFLERVRLAQICRQIVDAIPGPLPLDLRKTPASTIRTLDALFTTFLAQLPPFFQLDSASPDDPALPDLGTQRYLIHLGLHAHRATLRSGLRATRAWRRRGRCCGWRGASWIRSGRGGSRRQRG